MTYCHARRNYHMINTNTNIMHISRWNSMTENMNTGAVNGIDRTAAKYRKRI